MTKPKPMTEWQAATLPESLPLHFRRNVEQGDDECWIWIRSLSPDGYGWASFNNRTYQAHRLAYRLCKGDIPDGHHLDHLCRTRQCVNPAHLEPVTPAENLRRSELTPAGAKKCVRGHELSAYRGQRRCLTCLRDYDRAKRAGIAWESRRPYAKRNSEGCE